MIVQKHKLMEHYEVSAFTEQEMQRAKENLIENYQFVLIDEWMDQVGEEIWHFATFERIDKDFLGGETTKRELPGSKSFSELTNQLANYEKALQAEDEVTVTEASITLLGGTSLNKVLAEYSQMETVLREISNMPNLNNELLDAQQKAIFALWRS